MSLAPLQRVGCLLALLACGTGCASKWATQVDKKTTSLPAPVMAPDSVLLEVAFAHLPLADEATYNTIWAATDEQHFSTETRRQWSANGLRCGILGTQVPPILRDVMEVRGNPLEERSEDSAGQLEFDSTARRLQCRAGRRSKIVANKQKDSMSLLLRQGSAVRGEQLQSASCLFGMKAFPKGDGRVRLDLSPEVEHGELKQKWVGQEGALLQQVTRDRLLLDTLRLEGILSPGQTLVLSTTPDVKGLGEHFFTASTAGASQRTVLLIRLVQTQHDDLFAPDKITTPLATPGE